MLAVLYVIFVIVEDPQVEKYSEDRQSPNQRAEVVSHWLAWSSQSMGEKLIRRVEAEDQKSVPQRGKSLSEIRAPTYRQRSASWRHFSWQLLFGVDRHR